MPGLQPHEASSATGKQKQMVQMFQLAFSAAAIRHSDKKLHETEKNFFFILLHHDPLLREVREEIQGRSLERKFTRMLLAQLGLWHITRPILFQLSYTDRSHLPRKDDAHKRMCPLTLIINQDNALQTLAHRPIPSKQFLKSTSIVVEN